MTTIVSVSNLTDYQVLNPLGDALGYIADVVFDRDLEHSRYFVLSFGGKLGVGDKLFAVPVDAVRLDTENECLVLDVDRRQLESLPGFDRDHWPAAPEPGIEAAIRRFERSAP